MDIFADEMPGMINTIDHELVARTRGGLAIIDDIGFGAIARMEQARTSAERTGLRMVEVMDWNAV